MYPGQYQNAGQPQQPQQHPMAVVMMQPPSTSGHLPQQQAVQHVLVPQGWTPPSNQYSFYTTHVQSPHQPYYAMPSANPFAVQGLSYNGPPVAYTTQQMPVQYVIHPLPVAVPPAPQTQRLLELRRTASDGPAAFAHITPAPAYGLSNSVGSSYHQRYIRQFQNVMVQPPPQQPVGGVYLSPPSPAPKGPSPVITATISPQPSSGPSSARSPRTVGAPPPALANSNSLVAPSAQRPSSVSPVPSAVLDDGDPQPFLPPYEEILREGWLNFSASNELYLPFWMILYKDFLVCLDTNSRPLWKITLWGTSVETVPEVGKRFAILSGYGQVFWFEAETTEEAFEWVKVLRTEVYQPASRPPLKAAAAPASAYASSVGSSRKDTVPAPATPKLSAGSTLSPPLATSPQKASSGSAPLKHNASSSGLFGFIATLFTDTNDEELRRLVQETSQGPEQEQQIRKKLEQNLSTTVHSFGRAVDKFVASYRKSHSEAEIQSQDEKQFATAVAELLAFIREMSLQIVKLYPFLSDIDNIEQLCHEAVEVSLTPKLYPLIAAMYQRRYRADDAAHSKKISEFLTVTPAHLGIRKLFWLLRTGGSQGKASSAVDDPMAAVDETPPYYAAIRHLRSLPAMTSGHDKLNCLIETGKIICQCVKQFWEGQVDPMKLVVGADDLVPIFTYVLIKANVPHMHAEAAMIQDLMSEKAAMAVGGYSLATLQTCLQHITVLERQEVLKAAEDAAALIDKRDGVVTPSVSGTLNRTNQAAPVPTSAPAATIVSASSSSRISTNAEQRIQPAIESTFSLERVAAALAPGASSLPTVINPAITPVASSVSLTTATSETTQSIATTSSTTSVITVAESLAVDSNSDDRISSAAPPLASRKSVPDLITF